jgi:hypothetical protein
MTGVSHFRVIVSQLVTRYRGPACSPEQCQFALDGRFSNLIAVIISGNHVLMADEGTVYLLHFERPYRGPSRHYLGSRTTWNSGLSIIVVVLLAPLRRWPSIAASDSPWPAPGPVRRN